MQIAMLQDKIVPIEDLEPVYFDRGIYFGDGVYEVVRSYDGKIFAIEEHMQRFANSLAAIGITGVDIDEVRSRVQKAFEAAGIPSARIYFHVTRGSALREHTWDDNLKPNFFLTVTEAAGNADDKANGIAVSTHPDWRWRRCDIKSLNLLANVLARQDAAQRGCAEAILVDEAGLITEGSHSTFFAIFGQKLQTTPLTANVLPSITRKFVLEAAKNVGIEVVEQSLTPQQASHADELFVAGTAHDVVGVVRFDGQVIGDGKPGKYTMSLCRELLRFTA